MATATEPTLQADQVSYEDLYERWEAGNWSATQLDFGEDRVDWHEKFSDIERRGALWNYSMFFHGEDSVTDNLSPYIDAAPREEQKYFLATQQVDEARHAVFFARFMHEVVDTPATIGGSLAATKPELTWGFRKTFDRLDRMADELRKDRSKPKLAQAICMYHIIVEATLAQPGQHFIEDYLEDRGVLPGFREGMRNVSRDEQRHIAFGVKLLADLIREDPDCKYAVAELIREVATYSVGVFVPPEWDMRYIECFGSTMLDVYTSGMISFEARMQAAGLPLDELPGGSPYPTDLPPTERAERGIKLLRAGVLGEKNGTPSQEPEVMELMFDSVRRLVNTEAAPAGVTIQWDFADAPPWFVRVDNGATAAQQGRLEDADITLRCRYEDWTDVVAGREDPAKAVLKRKLRPKGRLRALWRARDLFPR